MLSENEKAEKRRYNREYRATPKGAASFAWNRLTSRAGAKYNHSQCYKDISVLMTREEFMAWAIPAYEEWFRTRPGESPSVDRIDPSGHYAPGNLRLIPTQENRRRARHFVADVAPDGTKWCPQCETFIAYDSFYPIKNLVCNRMGLSGWCKVCTLRKNKECQAKKKAPK